MAKFHITFLTLTYIVIVSSAPAKTNFRMDDVELQVLVERIIEKVATKFWYSVAHDEHVQAGLRYLNGCHFRKLMHTVEHDRNFKKLKILLAKNGIIDLSYRRLVPMKSIMQKVPNTQSNNVNIIPDFTSFVSDVEELLQSLPAGALLHYNLKHSSISKRIREASIGGVIRYYVDEVLTLKTTNVLLHELIRLSVNLDEFYDIIFAYFSFYDKEFQEDLVIKNVTQVSENTTPEPENPNNKEEGGNGEQEHEGDEDDTPEIKPGNNSPHINGEKGDEIKASSSERTETEANKDINTHEDEEGHGDGEITHSPNADVNNEHTSPYDLKGSTGVHQDNVRGVSEHSQIESGDGKVNKEEDINNGNALETRALKEKIEYPKNQKRFNRNKRTKSNAALRSNRLDYYLDI